MIIRISQFSQKLNHETYLDQLMEFLKSNARKKTQKQSCQILFPLHFSLKNKQIRSQKQLSVQDYQFNKKS